MRNPLISLVKSGLVCLLIIASAMNQTDNVAAQSADPSTLPLLSSSGLQYLGAFRLPTETVNGENFTSGGRTMAFNPATNSLYIVGLHAVAEVSIPSLVQSSDVNDLPYATLLQPFVDPAEGHIFSDMPGSALTGLMVHGNRLYGTSTIWYDAMNTQRVSHFSRSLQLNQPSFSGWSSVWEAQHSGLVSGFMATVPSEWRAKLGGPALTGQCCVSIVTRTSNGPAAFAFDPTQVGQSTVSATPLVYYTVIPGQDTLGPWEGSNPTYGATTYIRGMAVIAGTRTVLYFGNNGMGEYCYGNGTADISLAGTTGADGSHFCYDPTNAGKGQHGYPYRYQVWAYDLNDLAAVKAGARQPWEVRPYGVWPLDLPTPALQVALGGVAYDAVRQIVYVAQLSADTNNGIIADAPIIHAFRLSATPGAPSAPNTVSAVTLTPDRPAPQMAGTPITFTAQPTGGVAPYQYKWIVSDGSATVAAPWSTSNRFTWTPTVANANYQISVWVRSAGNTADVLEGSASLAFPIGAPAGTTTTAVALTANRVAPQAPMTAITWTATPTGGVALHQYKWRIFDGAAWTVGANWSTTNAFVWTPSTANTNYRVEVWMRSADNKADAQEASTATAFPIENVTASVLPDVTSVALAANKPAPQVAGTLITFSATPLGGTAPFLYKWFLSDDGKTWSVTGTWTSGATFTWKPAVASANHRVRVWVKNSANAADQPEASAEQAFPIGAVTTPPASTTPAYTPVSSVTLTANKLAPQPAGTTITLSATPSGGTAPFLYRWFVSDGTTWTGLGSWTSSASVTWTPDVANPYVLVRVWVKGAANSADQPEASAGFSFPINAGTHH